MGRIIISQNVTLDGTGQDPTGEEGFRHGGWFAGIGDRDRAAWAQAGLDEALNSEAMLMGRRTYEFLSSRWPARTGPWADRLNSMPKYVVSAALTEPASWTGTSVLGGDDLPGRLGQLRESAAGDVVVPASGRLVPLLLDLGLVDEIQLIVFPSLLGSGQRPLDGLTGPVELRLGAARTLGDNLVQLAYHPVRGA